MTITLTIVLVENVSLVDKGPEMMRALEFKDGMNVLGIVTSLNNY